MRLMRNLFLPVSLCVFVLVCGTASFAGNGVERSPWIEWDQMARKVQPDVRKAIEASIQEECPQLAALFGTENRLVVESAQVDEKASADPRLSSQSVLELTFKKGPRMDSEFKVRVAMEPMNGFLANGGRKDDNSEPSKMRAKVIEWIGVESCFGTNFGLKNEGPLKK